jgi:O-antigen ligase
MLTKQSLPARRSDGDSTPGSRRLERLLDSPARAAGSTEVRLLGILVVGFVAVVVTAVWSPLLAVLAAAPLLAALAAIRPGWILALALNGFFLYLVVLDLTDHAPRTRVTGTYYAILGAVMTWAAWRHRELILARVGARTRLFTLWALAAFVLAAWFLVNAALFREGGTLARNLAALLVLSSLPAAALSFGLTGPRIAQLQVGLVALGLVLVVADLVAFARGPTVEVGRFSPLEDLDPINAGLIPALAAVAAASFSPSSRRGYAAQALAVAVLVAASLAPGSRGPVFSLAAAALALALLLWRWSVLVPLAAIVLGLALGTVVSERLGTSEYFSQGVKDVVTEVSPRPKPAATPAASPIPISTFSMRKHWVKDAARAFPDRPIFGHGIATLRDTSPESRALGYEPGLIYPHNDLAEAAFSLGLVGLLPFVAWLSIPGILLMLRRGSRYARYGLATGVFAFAFLQSNVSGEIGADAALWSASALAMALYLDVRRGEQQLRRS